MKYFLHSTDSFEDEKVSELFMHYGYEGLGLFYTALEKIAKQEKPIKTIVLKNQLKVGKKLEKCWEFMESLGILSTNNGDTFNKQLLNFSEKYKIKKEKTAEKVKQWRENQIVEENVTSYKNKCNAPKVKESKVKEIKVKESKGFVVFENFDLSLNENLKKEKEKSSEKKEKVIPPWDTPEFENLWELYKRFRKEQHKFTFASSITEQAALKELSEISKGQEVEATKIINQTFTKGWRGLFPIKNEINGNSKTEYRTIADKVASTNAIIDARYGATR